MYSILIKTLVGINSYYNYFTDDKQLRLIEVVALGHLASEAAGLGLKRRHPTAESTLLIYSSD